MLLIVFFLYILQKRSKNELLNAEFWRASVRMCIATVVAGMVSFSMTKFIPLMATDNSLVITIPKFLLISGISVIAYLIASYFLNLKEAKPVISYIKRKLFKNMK